MQNDQSQLSQFLRYAAATVASFLVFSLYSIVDGLFVSHGIGEYAMSAVNLVSPFLNLLFSIAVLFAVGTSTVIAIFLGQGHREKANDLFSQNLVVLLLIGIAIGALVLLFPDRCASLLGAEGITLPYTVDYLRGLAPFAVCFVISYNMEILVKTDGHPRLAILAVTSGCLTNCLLDYLAIFVLDLGVWGAAAATGISQLLTCVIYLLHFLRGKSTFHLVRFRMDWAIYRRLIPLGISDGATELCYGLMVFLFNRTILRCIGQDGLVSYTIITYVTTLIANVQLGISQGTQPLVSYQYGKERPDLCRKLLHYALISVAAVAAVSFTGLFIFTPQLVRAFLGSADAALQTGAVRAFRRYSFCYLLAGFNTLTSGYMTAVEKSKAAIAISIGRGFAVQSAVLMLLALLWGGDMIWFAPVLSDGICLVFSLAMLGRLRLPGEAADSGNDDKGR